MAAVTAKAKRKPRRNRSILLLGFVLLVVGLFIRVADPAPVVALRMSYFDYLQRLEPRAYADLPVRVVDVDEDSLARVGQWPWPRDTIARMVDNLFAQGAAAVAFDVLFAEPDRYSPARIAKDPLYTGMIRDPEALAAYDNDEILANTIFRRPVVLGVAERVGGTDKDPAATAGFVQIGEDPAAAVPALPGLTRLAPPLGEHATGIGGINVAPETEAGIIRRVPLVWSTPEGFLPSLSLEALRLALGESTIMMIGTPGLAGALDGLRLGPDLIRTNPAGEIWVHYRHDDPRLYVPAADVLDDSATERVRPLIEGQIVLIGTSAAGLLDLRTTALGETVPGVSIHAQIIEQILQGDYLSRTDFLSGLELLTFVSLGLIVTIVMSLAGAEWSITAGATAGAAVLGVSWLAFTRNGLLFDATFPLVGGMLNFVLLALYQFVIADRDKRRIRRSFAHYVAPEVLDRIETSGHRLSLGGEIRDVTVMFSDIRNFTPLSETLSAEALVAVLNDLFTRLSTEILDEDGTIDKFIGDAIMAFWNAPIDIPEHPRRAAQAGLRMRAALAAFNASPIMKDRAPIRMAIGLATGEACVGNIGSAQRFNYTVIGDTVNTAARLETACRHIGYDIVASDAASSTGLAVLPAGYVALKGKTQRIEAWVVVGDVGLAAREDFASLAREHADLVALIRAKTDPAVFGAALSDCRKAAVRIEPGLGEFYDRLSARLEDFALE